VIHDSNGIHVWDGEKEHTVCPDVSAKIAIGESLGVAWTTSQAFTFNPKGEILSQTERGTIFDVALSKNDVVAIATRKGVVRDNKLCSGEAPSNIQEIELDPDGEFALAKCISESGDVDFYAWSLQEPKWRSLSIDTLVEYAFSVDSRYFCVFGKSKNDATQTAVMYGRTDSFNEPLASFEVSRNVRQIRFLEPQGLLALFDSNGIGLSNIGIYDLTNNRLVGEIKENATITKTAFSKSGLAFSSTGKRCSLWEMSPTNQLLVWDHRDVKSAYFVNHSLLIVRGDGKIESFDFSMKHDEIEAEIQSKTNSKLIEGGMITNK